MCVNIEQARMDPTPSNLELWTIVAKVYSNFQFQNGHSRKSKKFEIIWRLSTVTFMDVEDKQEELHVCEYWISKDGSNTFRIRVIIMDWCGKNFYRLPILECSI